MIARCTNPKMDSWKYYGARGITVCERWRQFALFLEDMGVRPTGKTLDRIDPTGNYEPGNCRWATPLEQGSTQRTNTRIELDGEVLTLAQWCRRFEIGVTTVITRLQRKGWSIRRALTTPVDMRYSPRGKRQ